MKMPLSPSRLAPHSLQSASIAAGEKESVSVADGAGEDVYLLWTNHWSTRGIGEVVFTIESCLNGCHRVRPTNRIRPGKLNIIIDEFTNPYFVLRLAEMKQAEPNTRYIIVATEFLTPVAILGLELHRTFNFFGSMRDWMGALRNLLCRSINRLPSYMERRYIGFVAALPICDLLLCVHPEIGRSLESVVAACPNLVAPPAVVYPELLTHLAIREDRLDRMPIGFNLTGSLTAHRRTVMRALERQFARVGWRDRIWEPVGFEQSAPVAFSGSAIRFNYDIAPDGQYLFNINPPQRRRWPFSSPMRIARAALLGQIPVVTRKFDDHDIEDIALLWDGRRDTALEIMNYRAERTPLVDSYVRSLEIYNATARCKNRKILDAIALLRR
jgi:hypothetical protein